VDFITTSTVTAALLNYFIKVDECRGFVELIILCGRDISVVHFLMLLCKGSFLCWHSYQEIWAENGHSRIKLLTMSYLYLLRKLNTTGYSDDVMYYAW